MKALVAVIVIINLFACAANRPSDVSQTGPDNANKMAQQRGSAASDPAKPVKSPHGDIITKDYELDRFGGFIGD